MRREIAQIILVILALNLFLASTTIAQVGTVVFVDPSLIQDHEIKPGSKISYPSAHSGNASVINPTYAYDKNPSTFANVTPTVGTTSWYAFSVQSFNATLAKGYSALDLKVNYSVTCWRGLYKFYFSVGSKVVTLDLQSNVNITTPTVKTWASLVEPNDGIWNQTDVNNLKFIVDVKRTSTTPPAGWCKFKEYEAWASIPTDSLAVRIDISDVTMLYTWQFNLTFNPAVLQVVAITEGPFLKQLTPPGTTFLTPIIDNTAGWIQAGAALKNFVSGGVNGSGELATVSFQAVAEGNSVFDFDEETTKLRTWDGNVLVPIEHTTASGFFQYLIGDANNDGDVNSADLVTFNLAFGSTPNSTNWNTYCDFDRDDKVIVSDLYDLGKHYGQT
jgi:hypothetical protein